MSNEIFDVLILGGGPAGLTAAIYTARAHLKTLVLAGNPPGGQLMLTTEVENFPGFPNGIQGPELIANFRAQAARFGTQIVDENATSISGNVDELFKVHTDNHSTYTARTIIVATGASAKWLNLESEQRLRGYGVSACATCDAFFFKNKVVAVVGGGDVAMEDSCFLTKFASKVYILYRGEKHHLKASKIMQERALTNPKVEFMFNTEVTEVLGDKEVTGLKIKNNVTGGEETLPVQGLFIAIGHKPNTDFLKDFITLGKGEYAEVKDNVLSNIPGVFISGDVADYKYRQAITAAGFGTMAALDAEKFLAEREHEKIHEQH